MKHRFAKLGTGKLLALATVAVGLALGIALGDLQAGRQSTSWTIQTITVRGVVRDSVINAMQEAGEEPELATRLAEVFGWDLDFYTDARRGDTFLVSVEKQIDANGQDQGYGRILAAEYDSEGRAYQAVLFHDASGRAAYYSADGRSLEKTFLRSPLKFTTSMKSNFSGSVPQVVLVRSLSDSDTDYQAPAGTPAQAISAGRVVFAGRKEADGNVVEVAHADRFESIYTHLSAVLVRSGQHVEAGGRIGLVGSANPASGAHMVLRILDHGEHRDFEALRRYQPPTEPVASDDALAFAAVRDRVLARLHEASLESRTTEPDDDLSGPR